MPVDDPLPDYHSENICLNSDLVSSVQEKIQTRNARSMLLENKNSSEG